MERSITKLKVMHPAKAKRLGVFDVLSLVVKELETYTLLGLTVLLVLLRYVPIEVHTSNRSI